MKRPPDRKVMLAAMVLLVAAGVMLSRPAVGTTDNNAGAAATARLAGTKGI